MKYIISYPPIPWARAGINNSRKSFYDKQKEYKDAYGYILRLQQKEIPLFYGPIKLSVTFFMELPTSHSLKKMRIDQHYHYFKPDLSNLIKFLEDAANGIIFSDDCIISQIDAKKIYADEARTEFEIEKL